MALEVLDLEVEEEGLALPLAEDSGEENTFWDGRRIFGTVMLLSSRT